MKSTKLPLDRMKAEVVQYMGSAKSLVAVESSDGASQRPIPDVLLPSQFFESVGKRTFSSEQRLMLALLADAINVLVRQRGSLNGENRNHFNEAWLWVFAHHIVSVSFDDACDAIGLNAECLRRHLSEVIAGQGGSLRRLRLKDHGRRQRPNVNILRRR
jgi:hypothetical protein